MSSDIGLVRFPDGYVMVARFNGSSDTLSADLTTLDNAIRYPELAWHLEWVGEDDEVEDVELWTRYGGGEHWVGKAHREGSYITQGHNPSDDGPGFPTRGTPDWAAEALASIGWPS